MTDALDALRKLTRGPKGDRADYVGQLSCAHATQLVEWIDRVQPIYDAYAFTEDEMRYLRLYRSLTDEGRAECNKFATYLTSRRTAEGE